MPSLAVLAAGALLLPAVALVTIQTAADPANPPRGGAPPAQPGSPQSTPRQPGPPPPGFGQSGSPQPGSPQPQFGQTTVTTARAPQAARPQAQPSPDSPAPQPGADATPLGQWAWPLRPRPLVVRGFAVGPQRWSPGHRGVDLRSAVTASTGETKTGNKWNKWTIFSPARGTVRFSGVIAGRPVLSITHRDGLISSFEPVDGAVRPGQVVERGEVVGRLAAGPTHCAPADCLHWGVRHGDRYLNPLLLVPVSRGPAVLLPMVPP